MSSSITPKFTKNNAILTFPESVVIIERQVSSFGPDEYLNVGIAYRDLGLPAKIKENLCHLRFRGDVFLEANEQRQVLAWLTTRGAQIEEGVGKLMALLDTLTTLKRLRAAYEQQPSPFANMLIRRELRMRLES